jgi:hypothetical protein
LRGIRSEVLSFGLHGIALAGVLLAINLGIGPRRLWPAAAFLGVSTAATAYIEAVVHLARRRARKQRDAEVPHGVRLRRPVWMSISDVLWVVWIGSTLGAVAAGAGFPAVGIGILMTVCALVVATAFIPYGRDECLTFEPDGLRIHLRGATFLVPWEAIHKVDRGGTESHRLLLVQIDALAPVLRSVAPDTPRARMRARIALGEGDDIGGSGGKLTFTPWTAGLDGTVLAGAIRAAVDRRHGRLN